MSPLFDCAPLFSGTTAGFDRAVVAPINIPLNASWAGGLSTLDAAIGTPHGPIASSWALLAPSGGGPGGDPCAGTKKALGSEVACGPRPSPAPANASRPAYLLTVTVPIGAAADVVVPLRGLAAGAVTIMEGGVAVWRGGAFVGRPGSVPGVSAAAADAALGGVRFAVAQGRYRFTLLVP